MAVGTIKRHDGEPSPRLVINAAAGGAYDLTNHSARMTMKLATTLSVALDNVETTVDLPAAIVDVVEIGDILLIDHERLTISGSLPTQPIATSDATFTMTRASGTAATAGQLLGTTDVAGLGTNQYRFPTNAVFTLAVDSGTPAAVTLLAANTTTNNTMADLVADVNTAIGLAGLGVTASAANDKMVFTSNSTGAASNVAISAPDAIAVAELGVVASYGVGLAATTTTAAGHALGVPVGIVKIERTAIIEAPATAGTVTFEWVAGDTDKLGTFLIEFEITTPSGKKFTAPNNDSFDVEVVTDFGDN